MDKKRTLAIRAVSNSTRVRLAKLKEYTRLTYGSIIDDAVEALWMDYVNDGHDLDSG